VEQNHLKRATRRTVLSGIAATLAPGTVAAPAQQRDGMRRLGFISSGLASDQMAKDISTAFLQGLGSLGWKEDVNLHIDWRWYGGDAALAARLAAEVVALAPDAILAGGNIAVEPILRQTKELPVVFALVSDPVGMGYVESLARPNGNITGFSSFDPPIYTKMLQMLTEVVPPAQTVAILYNPDSAPYAARMLRALEKGAKAFGVTVRDGPCHDDAEIEALLASLARNGSGGLLALGDVFNQIHRQAIIAAALKYRVPTIVNTWQMTEEGGLMSYTIDIPDLYRRAAAYVDRVLKGAKPGDLPVQRPIKFQTLINLKTAKALGITVAPQLLATADEVIE
jgi:putative tryptophan/tyrosine transport system substrate-binding protein